MKSHLGITGRLLIVITWMGLSISVMSQETTYSPVDIGQHIDQNGVLSERLSDVGEIFYLDKDNRSGIDREAYQTFLDLRNQWMEEHREEYLIQFAPDPVFYVDEEAPVDVIVKEFSHNKVRVYIVFTIGHSRWHHYYLLLKDYLIDRDELVDKIFRLKQIEGLYAATYKGIGHGASFHDLVRRLGLNYREYTGQSMQYRTLYYPDDNVEVILQDGVVKYLALLKQYS